MSNMNKTIHLEHNIGLKFQGKDNKMLKNITVDS
jgi:hypothetical protein